MQRAPAPPDRGGAKARPRALPRVQALIDAGRDRGSARNTSWWERVLESIHALTRPPILRHAIAALERGNLDAAFALLREEVKVRPGQAESALLFWNAAVSCERAGEAAEAMARLVRSEAATEDGLERAANHWTALVSAVPEVVVDVAALAKLVPLLRARSEQARGDAAKTEALALLADTLRRCVDPAHGPLSPALALRLVEEARGVDAQVALAAARIALTSAGLHEAKRAKLEEFVAALERGEWPDAASAAASPRPTATTVAPSAAPRKAPLAAAPPPAAPKVKPKPAAEPARVAAPRPEPAPRPKARAAAPAIPPEEKGASTGRRTVALTQDEIEAASSRLAERMAARPAAAAAQPESAATARPAPLVPEREPEPFEPEPVSEPVAAAPVLDVGDALAELDEPEPEKEEPIAFLEQDDAVAILEDDDGNAILEVDDANAILEVDADGDAPVGAVFADTQSAPLSADEPEAVLQDTDPQLDGDASPEFEFGGAAAAGAATGPRGEHESVDATLDETDAPAPDFAFGSAEAGEPDVEFAFGAEAEEELDAADADFEIADACEDAETDLGEDLAIGDEPAFAEPIEEPIAELAEAPIAEPVGEAPAPAPPPALRAIDILPVEIGDESLVAYEVAQAQRTRVDYRAVEAIAAAEVTDLADEPTLVALLVLRARPGRPRSALRMRCDTFDPASLFPERTDAGQALRSMLSDLLERTRAIPLPSPDSALAIQPQRFESLAAFEAAVVARLGG